MSFKLPPTQKTPALVKGLCSHPPVSVIEPYLGANLFKKKKFEPTPKKETPQTETTHHIGELGSSPLSGLGGVNQFSARESNCFPRRSIRRQSLFATTIHLWRVFKVTVQMMPYKYYCYMNGKYEELRRYKFRFNSKAVISGGVHSWMCAGYNCHQRIHTTGKKEVDDSGREYQLGNSTTHKGRLCRVWEKQLRDGASPSLAQTKAKANRKRKRASILGNSPICHHTSKVNINKRKYRTSPVKKASIRGNSQIYHRTPGKNSNVSGQTFVDDSVELVENVSGQTFVDANVELVENASQHSGIENLSAEITEIEGTLRGPNKPLPTTPTEISSESDDSIEIIGEIEGTLRGPNKPLPTTPTEISPDDLATSLGDLTTQEEVGEGQEEWMRFRTRASIDADPVFVESSCKRTRKVKVKERRKITAAKNVKLSDDAIIKMSNQMKDRVKCLSLKGSLTENVASFTLPVILEQCQFLEYLNICKIERDVQEKAEASFDPSSLKLPKNLKYVQLDHTINYDKFIDFATRHCPNLEVIQYVNDHGLPVTKKLMNSIVKLENLKYLHLDLSSLEELAEFVPTFKFLGGLKGLVLEQVDNQIVTEIASNCRQLEHLTLTRDESLGESLREGLLKVCTLPKLRSISLQYLTSAENVRPERTEVYVHMFEGLNQTGVLECIEIVDPVLIPIEVVCQALKACPKLNTVYADINPKHAYQILFDTMNEIRGAETAPSSENDPGIVYIKEWSAPEERRHKWVRFFDEQSPVGRVAHEIRMSSLSEKPQFLNNIPLILDESHPLT
ncbi:hypothetical protein Ddc_14767 [Ditylenchus destructor]|nr:hypothetical protein Ddc_14767 [Ditylenchus destructor]